MIDHLTQFEEEPEDKIDEFFNSLDKVSEIIIIIVMLPYLLIQTIKAFYDYFK